jgi:hypothetical protein
MIRKLIKSIDKKEWRFIIILSIVVILLTTLPYLYGWYQTPEGHTYTGLHSLTPGDIHVYFSFMDQAREGNFISKDLYTGEPQARVLLNSFWSIEGLIGRVTGLSNILVFQLSRILLIPIFIFTLYLFSCLFFNKKVWRKISIIFLTFASGLGVTITIFLPDSVYAKGWYNWPLDLWAPESNNLLTMFQSPHLIASTILIIFIMFLMFLAYEHNKLKYSVSAGVLALILFQFHPFHTPTIFAVLSTYILVKVIQDIKKYKDKSDIWFNYVKHSLVLAVVSFPSIFYWLLLQQFDFVTQLRVYQNVCLTPSLWVTAVSYGFVLLLAIYASYRIIRHYRSDNKHIFLVVWFVIHFLMLYSPFLFQRRIMQGLQVPMTILCVYGVYFLYEYLKKKLPKDKFEFFISNKHLAIIVFILLFTSAGIYNWIREIAVFTEVYPQLYVPDDKIAGYKWLKNNTNEDDVILTDLYNGNLIPGRIMRKVYVGHGVETLFFDNKFMRMVWFFSFDEADDKKEKFLRDNNIDYIFYSGNEKGIGDYNPAEKNYLEPVFHFGDTDIYKVNEENE